MHQAKKSILSPLWKFLLVICYWCSILLKIISLNNKKSPSTQGHSLSTDPSLYTFLVSTVAQNNCAHNAKQALPCTPSVYRFQSGNHKQSTQNCSNYFNFSSKMVKKYNFLVYRIFLFDEIIYILGISL